MVNSWHWATRESLIISNEGKDALVSGMTPLRKPVERLWTKKSRPPAKSQRCVLQTRTNTTSTTYLTDPVYLGSSNRTTCQNTSYAIGCTLGYTPERTW